MNRENGRISILGAAALLALVIAAGVLWYVYGRSGHMLDEALAASRPRRSVLPGRRRRLLPRHGRGGPAADAREEIQGTELVDRLDRRQRSLLGRARRQRVRRARFPEDRLVASEPEGTAAITAGSISGWSTSRASSSRPVPIRSGTASGSISGRRIARPIRSKTSRSIPVCARSRARGKTIEKGSYYGYATGIVGLRLFPESGFDERAAKAWDAERYYTDPTYYNSNDADSAVSRGHVVRVLPRRSEPDQAAGGSEQPEVGEPQLERRRAVLLGRPDLLLGRRSRRTSSSSCFTPRGRARSTRR